MIRAAAAALFAASLLAGVPASAQAPPAPPDVSAPPADAERTPSGLASKLLEPGKGERKTTATDVVTVHYTLWTTDGKVVDSTRTKGQPARFTLLTVFPGWRECATKMVIGEKRRCWVPQELAYKGQKGRPAGMLVVDIELLAAEPSPTIPPPDVAKPPADAQRTPSGLYYKVLQPGIGARKPYQGSRVTVHYTGWTTEGKMFDSSIMRGQPTTFDLNQVIKGWTEGVQLMVQGEKTRFWIPESLAYAQGGGPKGMLVFDIELIRIE
jgi:FKBP-type peptidyl-prolyl cis-trans isomerase